jgi:hypothetical protein
MLSKTRKSSIYAWSVNKLVVTEILDVPVESRMSYVGIFLAPEGAVK